MRASHPAKSVGKGDARSRDMKAIVDKETCTGCGLCEEACPEVFQLGDDVAEVIVGEIPPDAEESARQAAEECPVEAITIQE
jgi:ferredoxin